MVSTDHSGEGRGNRDFEEKLELIQVWLSQKEQHPIQVDKVNWRGDIGLWKKKQRAGKVRYDFVQRDAEGQLHVYYGVTEDGIHGPWREFLEGE